MVIRCIPAYHVDYITDYSSLVQLTDAFFENQQNISRGWAKHTVHLSVLGAWGEKHKQQCVEKMWPRSLRQFCTQTDQMVTLFQTFHKDSALGEIRREWKPSVLLVCENTNMIKMINLQSVFTTLLFNTASYTNQTAGSPSSTREAWKLLL